MLASRGYRRIAHGRSEHAKNAFRRWKGNLNRYERNADLVRRTFLLTRNRMISTTPSTTIELANHTPRTPRMMVII